MIDEYQLAAFSIDFEGTVSLGKSTNPCGTVSYRPRVNIFNTSKPLLVAFMKCVGFGHVTDSPSYGNGEDAAGIYYWKLTAAGIREHLPKIASYLVLKQLQADLLLRAFDYIKTDRAKAKGLQRPQDDTYALEDIFQELAVLNAKAHTRQILTDAEKFLIQLRKRGV